jgi:hypothetical protein
MSQYADATRGMRGISDEAKRLIVLAGTEAVSRVFGDSGTTHRDALVAYISELEAEVERLRRGR